MNEFLSMKSRGNKMKHKLKIISIEILKYIKGFTIGFMLAVILNSYNHVIKVHLDPQLETITKERLEKLK